MMKAKKEEITEPSQPACPMYEESIGGYGTCLGQTRSALKV